MQLWSFKGLQKKKKGAQIKKKIVQSVFSCIEHTFQAFWVELPYYTLNSAWFPGCTLVHPIVMYIQAGGVQMQF